MCWNEKKEYGITSFSAHVISKKYPQKAEIQQCVLTILSLPWLAENASQSQFEMQQGKTKPVRMSWGDVYWEPHVVRNRVRGRDGERERETVPSLHDSVPETHVTLLPPQWVTLTGYCLCSVPPLCDWWASFCQLMENPLLTTIRLPFVTVSVPDCHRFILIRDLFLLRLLYCASNLPNWARCDIPGKWPTAVFAVINLFTKCAAYAVEGQICLMESTLMSTIYRIF